MWALSSHRSAFQPASGVKHLMTLSCKIAPTLIRGWYHATDTSVENVQDSSVNDCELLTLCQYHSYPYRLRFHPVPRSRGSSAYVYQMASHQTDFANLQ